MKHPLFSRFLLEEDSPAWQIPRVSLICRWSRMTSLPMVKGVFKHLTAVQQPTSWMATTTTAPAAISTSDLQDPSPVGRPLGVFEFLSRLDICFQQQAGRRSLWWEHVRSPLIRESAGIFTIGLVWYSYNLSCFFVGSLTQITEHTCI